MIRLSVYQRDRKNLEIFKKESRDHIADLQIKCVGYEKDLDTIKERTKNHTAVLVGVTITVIGGIVLSFIK